MNKPKSFEEIYEAIRKARLERWPNLEYSKTDFLDGFLYGVRWSEANMSKPFDGGIISTDILDERR